MPTLHKDIPAALNPFVERRSTEAGRNTCCIALLAAPMELDPLP
jgi:hypothetical protein